MSESAPLGLAQTSSSQFIGLLLGCPLHKSNFGKKKYAEIQLEVAPDIGVPNTRAMHFIWVHYMQYWYLYTIFNEFKIKLKKLTLYLKLLRRLSSYRQTVFTSA